MLSCCSNHCLPTSSSHFFLLAYFTMKDAHTLHCQYRDVAGRTIFTKRVNFTEWILIRGQYLLVTKYYWNLSRIGGGGQFHGGDDSRGILKTVKNQTCSFSDRHMKRNSPRRDLLYLLHCWVKIHSKSSVLEWPPICTVDYVGGMKNR